MSPLAVLIGPPAAGKTRVGKRVAQELGVSFIDTDKRVATEHGAIPDIFARHGEAQFRRWERDAVIDALKSDGIVSLGGGAILDLETQRDLAEENVVLITATPEAIEPRLTSGTRPLLTGGIEAWKELVASRQPIYERLATMTVDTSRGTMESIAGELAERLRVNS